MAVPSDMYFESVVQPEHEGWPLLDSLSARFTYHSKLEWADKIARGLVCVNGEAAHAATVVHRNDKVVYHVENYSEPEVPTHYQVLFEDEEFLVVAKPAGVPVHHTGRIFYNTFTSIIRRGTDCEAATPMHRLDRDNGGIMLFAKYAETAARFQKNLDRILLKKFYVAVVRGDFPEGESDFALLAEMVRPCIGLLPDGGVDCQMPLREDAEDCLRLRMHHRDDGKPCQTLFKKVGGGFLPSVGELPACKVPERYSVVECQLVTGRKHQIRAHLSELGFPIVGDRLYSFGGKFYEKMTTQALSEEDYAVLGAKSQMLYAFKAEIQLPYWKEPRIFECRDFPEEMKKLVRQGDIQGDCK